VGETVSAGPGGSLAELMTGGRFQGLGELCRFPFRAGQRRRPVAKQLWRPLTGRAASLRAQGRDARSGHLRVLKYRPLLPFSSPAGSVRLVPTSTAAVWPMIGRRPPEPHELPPRNSRNSRMVDQGPCSIGLPNVCGVAEHPDWEPLPPCTIHTFFHDDSAVGPSHSESLCEPRRASASLCTS